MKNCNPPSGLFVKMTGAAKGDNDWLINPFELLSSHLSLRTTNSALDIE